MEFGIFAGFTNREGQSQAETFDEWLALAREAEALGIDCFWLAEFHFRPRTIISAPLIIASAIAAQTQRIKVGLAVQLLPLANPIRLAEEAATVDHISKGRLIFGVGRSSFIDAYRGYNVDYAESRGRFLEALDIVRGAWASESFSYRGQFYEFKDVNVVPKPLQSPYPPIRIACESRETFALMGKFGYPIFMRHQLDVPELQSLLKQYEQARHAAGFSGPNDVTLQVPVYVASSAAQARADTEAGLVVDRERAIEFAKNTGDQEAYERLTRVQAPRYDQLVQQKGLGIYPSPNLFGSPSEVADRLHEYQDMLGVTGVSLTINPGGISYEQTLNSMRLLAEQVMPKFK